MPTVVYHYTNAVNYNEIIGNIETRDGKQYIKLLSSTSAISGDAHYGPGWYYTDLPPRTGSRIGIARALWDGSYERNLRRQNTSSRFSFTGTQRSLSVAPMCSAFRRVQTTGPKC
jgi:hypothetical protein